MEEGRLSGVAGRSVGSYSRGAHLRGAFSLVAALMAPLPIGICSSELASVESRSGTYITEALLKLGVKSVPLACRAMADVHGGAAESRSASMLAPLSDESEASS